MEGNAFTTENERDLIVTAESKAHLAGAAKWAKFLAVLSFVLTGLMVFLLLVSGSVSLSPAMNNPYGRSVLGWPYIIGCIVVLLIYLIPTYYLYSFAVKCKHALRENASSFLADSFRRLNKCYAFVGIFTIIALILYVLIIIWAVFMMGNMM